MRFDIITIFPRIFDSYFNESIVKRAREKEIVKINIHNLREFTEDERQTVDGRPYGGGAGMVLMAEPILKAVESLKISKNSKTKVVVFSAKGKQFNQKMAYDWSKKLNQIIFICGRYEGIDERVVKILKAEEVSVGPYVLTDGEIPAMMVVSAVTRLLPGAIKLESLAEESHWNVLIKREKMGEKGKMGNGGLEYPHYTRPEVIEYKGKKYRVPKVLLSGNHKAIEEWRKSAK